MMVANSSPMPYGLRSMSGKGHNTSNIAVDAVPRIHGNSALAALNPSVSDELVSLQDSQLASMVQSGEMGVGVAASLNNTAISNAQTNIVITNSRQTHIGDTHVRNIAINVGTKKSKKKSKKNINPSVLKALCNSTESVTCTHVKNVRIGSPWRMVMRDLNLSDPDIDNNYEQYMTAGGTEEVIYQLLRLWVESNGSEATLGKLSTALWAEKQIDALETLAATFVPMKKKLEHLETRTVSLACYWCYVDRIEGKWRAEHILSAQQTARIQGVLTFSS